MESRWTSQLRSIEEIRFQLQTLYSRCSTQDIATGTNQSRVQQMATFRIFETIPEILWMSPLGRFFLFSRCLY
jgi:hypothetical protein